MKSTYKHLFMVLLPLVAFAVSCQDVPTNRPQGALLYGYGKRVMRIDLDSQQAKVIYEFADVRMPKVLGKIDTDKLLLSLWNGFGKGHGLYLFDLRDSTLAYLCDGKTATHLEQLDILVYFQGESLYYRKLCEDSPECFLVANNINASWPMIGNPRPVRISGSSAAYYTTEEKIEIRNFADSSVRLVDISGYIPQAYHELTNRLICRPAAGDGVYSIDIKSLGIKKLDIGYPSVAYHFIASEKQNCLFYSKVEYWSLSEHTNMWVYWLDQDIDEKYLTKNSFLGDGVFFSSP